MNDLGIQLEVQMIAEKGVEGNTQQYEFQELTMFNKVMSVIIWVNPKFIKLASLTR